MYFIINFLYCLIKATTTHTATTTTQSQPTASITTDGGKRAYIFLS
jgi:hypothetical protein